MVLTLVVAVVLTSSASASLIGPLVQNPDTGHWYGLIDGNSTDPHPGWLEVNSEAIALGGNLVAINNSQEEIWLQGTFGTNELWIGFTDQETEGIWKWTNGEPVTYTHWIGVEPNNAGNEDHAFMNFLSNGWADIFESGEHASIPGTHVLFFGI